MGDHLVIRTTIYKHSYAIQILYLPVRDCLMLWFPKDHQCMRSDKVFEANSGLLVHVFSTKVVHIKQLFSTVSATSVLKIFLRHQNLKQGSGFLVSSFQNLFHWSSLFVISHMFPISVPLPFSRISSHLLGLSSQSAFFITCNKLQPCTIKVKKCD